MSWLRVRMTELGYRSLNDLAVAAGSDKGNLSRIFRQQQRPRVDALEPLASALSISVYELLVRIGAVDPDADRPMKVDREDGRVTFTWPQVPR